MGSQWISGFAFQLTLFFREHSGSVEECLTLNRGAAGSSLTGITAFCP